MFLSIAGSNNTSQAGCDSLYLLVLPVLSFQAIVSHNLSSLVDLKNCYWHCFSFFCMYVQIKVRTFKLFTCLTRNQYYVTNIYKHYKKDDNLVYLFLVFVFLIFFRFFIYKRKSEIWRFQHCLLTTEWILIKWYKIRRTYLECKILEFFLLSYMHISLLVKYS